MNTAPTWAGGNPSLVDHVPGERQPRSSRSPEVERGSGRSLAVGGPTKWQEPSFDGSWSSAATGPGLGAGVGIGAGAGAGAGAGSHGAAPVPSGGKLRFGEGGPVVGELRGEIERLERDVQQLREEIRKKEIRMQVLSLRHASQITKSDREYCPRLLCAGVIFLFLFLCTRP
jgi:hypothetical protein